MADEGDSLSIESCSAQAEEEERSQRVDSTNSNHGWTRKAKKGKEALKAEEAPPKNALSWTVIGILSLTMFGNSLTMTSLFPFVGYMVSLERRRLPGWVGIKEDGRHSVLWSTKTIFAVSVDAACPISICAPWL